MIFTIFKQLIACCAAILIVSLAGGSAAADVIDFEDLYVSGVSEARLTAGYAGFNWSGNTWVINKNFYNDANWQKGTIGNASIFGGYAFQSYPVWFNTAEPGYFNFQSAYITSAYAGVTSTTGSLIAPEAYSVTVEGWRNSTREYMTTVEVSGELAEFDFNFNGIDTLWFKPGLASQIVIDNIEYDRATPVPEPSSMVLFGVVILVFFGRAIISAAKDRARY